MGQPSTQYEEGQHLKGSDGKLYVVRNGLPVLASANQTPMTVAPPPWRVQQTQREEARKEQDQTFQTGKDARDRAEAPYRQRILSAQATEAEAKARDATIATTAVDPALDKLTGDDYVSRLPAETRAQVQALSSGRMAFPSGSALKSPYWQTMLQHVAHYDPNFDAVNYNARAATRRDFVSGKSAQNIRALNTAIGHLAQLNGQVSGTASHGGLPGATIVNQIENALSRSAGSSGITNFEQTAGAVASELTQVFRGSGGAEADIQREIDHLSPNASLEQKKASIQNIAGLLKSRLDAIGDQYTKGMGTTAQPLQMLNSHAGEAYKSLLGIDPNLDVPPAGGDDRGGGGHGGTGGSAVS
ncbi:MAG: hypothetical protein OSB00_06625, partial [Sphingomonas bacterium]|nr:hypothetical protein [Sphingomonas bacterium]